MNLDYLFIHLPTLNYLNDELFPVPPPDGLGMSILITSPGLLYAVRAPWRASRTWWLAGAALARPDPDAPLLRRRLAPVRLPLRARLDPVRLGAVRLAAASDAARNEFVGIGVPRSASAGDG